MEEHATFGVELERGEGYEFTVRFDQPHVSPLLMDEPEPLGKARGPNAARLLGAAVGNCLSASLLFCLEKSKLTVKRLETEVKGFLSRNERGRLRVSRLDVHLKVDVPGVMPQRVSRCIEIFEDYCVVTGSVRKGIEVNVFVTDPTGVPLYQRSETSEPVEQSGEKKP